jgi:homocitrate synthase NifV
MIRVMDKTLSCLDQYQASPRQLREICELLLALGADFIELSENAYRQIGTLPRGGKYILRLENLSEIPQIPEIGFYLRRMGGDVSHANVIHEVHLNSISEIFLLRQYHALPYVRVTGLDDIMCHNTKMAFGQIVKNLPGKIEFCPENGYACATAAAVEWILSGERNVVTAFNGMGDSAPTEEVFLALRLLVRYKPTQDYSKMPLLCRLLEEITGIPIPKHKPVIGRDIFNVESGIHADGISKNSKIYEPYKPELVGVKRRLVIGKHSGKAAVMLKMKQMGLTVSPDKIPKIVRLVHRVSIDKKRSLTDDEFRRLIQINAAQGGDYHEAKKEAG